VGGAHQRHHDQGCHRRRLRSQGASCRHEWRGHGALRRDMRRALWPWGGARSGGGGGGARRCCSCCSCWTYCSFFSTSVFQENQFISQRLGQRLSGYKKSRCFLPSLDPRAEQCKFYYKTLHLSVRQNLARFQRTASALDPATLTNAFLVLLVTGPKLMFLLIARMSGDV
jgi:hypothetical protein